MKILKPIILYFLFLLLAFPLFYFVYKFADPEPLAHDFFQYYYLYKDFDIGRVIAPHNMRLAGAFFVYLFYKANIFYDTVSCFDNYTAWGFLKQVYFDAILVNYLSVAATCWLMFYLQQRYFKDVVFSFLGSVIYLLGFGTLFYELMPGTDAFSIFLFTATLYWYLDKSYLILIPLLILVLQREYILIAFATLAIIDFITHRNRYSLLIFLSTCLFFALYLVLRKTIFYTPHLDYQASAGHFMSSVYQPNFPWALYLKQMAMTLTLFYLYLLIILYKKWNKMEINGLYLFKFLFLFLQINIISYLAGHGTNCGRYFYMLSPLLIFVTMQEMWPVLRPKDKARTVIDQ